jgi:hypothetical protein
MQTMTEVSGADEGFIYYVLCWLCYLLAMVVVFAWLSRLYEKAGTVWKHVGAGTVADIVVYDVPYITEGACLGYPAYPVVAETAITFDDGRTLNVNGDFTSVCGKGARISVLKNGLGMYRVISSE